MLLYKERTFIVEFQTSQMCVTRLRSSFDWFQWFRQGENTHSHACHTPVHTPAHQTRTHSHTHSKADSRTYVHSLDTYKNWNTNTNNTTIKTLYFFIFRNPYSYVLYSVERQLSFNKWTLFFCLSLKWSVRYHHNENSYSLYIFLSMASQTDRASRPLFTGCRSMRTSCTCKRLQPALKRRRLHPSPP